MTEPIDQTLEIIELREELQRTKLLLQNCNGDIVRADRELASLREQLAKLETQSHDQVRIIEHLEQDLVKERELRKELVIMLDVAKDDIANEWTHIQIESLIQKAKDKSHE